MTRFETGAALLGVALFFVALEIGVKWKSILPAQSMPPVVAENEKKQTPPSRISSVSLSTIEKKIEAKDFFDTQALSSAGISLKNGRYALALFQHAPVIASKDSFYLVSFTIQKDGKTIGTVSRILPTEKMSAARLFLLVRQKLETVVSGKKTKKFYVSDYYNTVGEANFYLNDKENFPNTVFLITRSKTKVLAFQFNDKYDESVKKNLIPLFFQ